MSDPDTVFLTALMMAQGLYPEDPLFTASIPAEPRRTDGPHQGLRGLLEAGE